MGGANMSTASMGGAEALPVVVYTSASQMRTPGTLLRAMWKDLGASRELAWRLFIRDISAQYRQSLFGVFWAFVPPIVTALIFIVLQTRNVVNFGETDIPYPVYVLVGTTLWQLFTESLNAPLKSVTAARALLVKINFPREALIISAIWQVLFNLGTKLLVLAAIFWIFRLELTWGILGGGLAMVMLLLLGIGIGLLLTPLGMLYTDVATSLPIVTQMLFFVTPIVYPPLRTFPLSLVTVLNPVSPLLIGARDLLTKGTLENGLAFSVVSVLTLFLLLGGWLIYRVALPILIERMSA
ncbi:MAG: transport permease protein [Litorilinea sp.]|nr:MAG: transport permease protein [Litorilinea sp.]